ncbi:hypothetical protein ACFL56_02915 [Candidatus Margulisiibacteriota bacterium]
MYRKIILFKHKRNTNKLTIKDMHRLAKEKGGKCISQKYLGSKIKHEWQCKRGHLFKIRPKEIKKGYWCPTCKEKIRKQQIQKKLKEIIKLKGGKCISKEYESNKIKIEIECKKGHVFKLYPKQIKEYKWCPECTKKKKRKIMLMVLKKIAQNKNGKLITIEYLGSHTKHNWQCNKGHIFEMEPRVVKHNHWCPICGNKRKGRKKKECVKK